MKAAKMSWTNTTSQYITMQGYVIATSQCNIVTFIQKITLIQHADSHKENVDIFTWTTRHTTIKALIEGQEFD